MIKKCKEKKIPDNYGINGTSKVPRSERFVEDAMEHTLVWQFTHLDIDHVKWGWKYLNINEAYNLLEKLKSYESMKLKELHSDKKRDHRVLIKEIDMDARKRLKELHLDDREDLFRLRLSGQERIWGILDRYIFKIIWWDPKHEIYKYKKKNT